MPDEQNYTSHLLELHEALEKLYSTGGTVEANVLQIAYQCWQYTEEILTREATSVSGPSLSTPESQGA